MEPATRRPAPGPMPGAGSAPLPTQARGAPALAPEKSTDEQAVSSGQQLSYTEVSSTSGTLKPTAKGTGTAAEPAASKDAAPRRTSAGSSGSVSGPLSSTPKGTTFTAAQVEARAPPPRGATRQKPGIRIGCEEHEEVPRGVSRGDREQATGPDEG
jgi:imidazolonepropionase-like amidohydrolase